MLKFLLFNIFALSLLAAPVDLSVAILDIKYNTVDGVKICEVQTSSCSEPCGYDVFYEGQYPAAKEVIEAINRRVKSVWYIKPDVMSIYISELIKKDPLWKGFSAFQTLFNNSEYKVLSQTPPRQENRLDSYEIALYASPKRIRDVDDFRKNHPGVVLIDSALRSSDKNKYEMNRLFQEVPEANKLKSRWGLYKKGYSLKLVQEILNDIPSDLLVIKPRSGTKGYGVNIIKRGDLEKTLKKIFKNSSKNSKEDSLSYWIADREKDFLVEEYIPSDPILAPRVGEGLYDATLRVQLLLAYSEGKAEMEWISTVWKVPVKSLEEKGTLTEKHRSCADDDHITAVDEAVQEAVKRDLEAHFVPLYLEMAKRG